MATQINPALARIWLPDGSRQYGYRKPLLVWSSSEADQRALDYLEHGVSNSQFESLSQLAKIEDRALEHLLERLGPAVRTGDGFAGQLSQTEIQDHFAELARLFLECSDEPGEVLARRRASRVFIESIGRVGLTITRGLESSFIGTMLTLDNSSVATSDIGPLGFETEDRGRPRVAAAKRAIQGLNLEQHSRLSRSMDTVDIAILIATDVVSPDSYAQWMRREIPHVSILFDESGVQVSPVVVPGITPCLACAEIARIEQQPDWVSIAPQLAQLDRTLEDSAMLFFAASIALNQTLNLLDLGIEGSDQLSFRLERSGAVSSFQAQTSDCGCRSFR